MIDFINQSRLKNVVWTDPGWLIYHLEDDSDPDPDSDPRLPDLQPSCT